MKFIKENLNEILLAYYIFSYVLLARVVPNYLAISTNVLLINVIMVLLISIIYNRKRLKLTIQEIILYLIIILYAVIDYNFRFNEFTIQTYIYMIIFAIIPTFLFVRIEKIEKIFVVYGFFSVVIALLFVLDPFQEYKYSGDYMGFGYNVMMIAYIGLYILIRNRKSILLKILWIIVTIEIIFFANKGAIFSIVLFTLLYEILIKKNTLKNLLILVIGCILLVSSNFIIDAIYKVAVQNGIDSYSIKTLYQMSNKTSSGLSGREEFWNEAISELDENILFGNGAGYYRTTNNGKYSHNLIFDILIEYGIIIFMILAIIILKGILKLKKVEGKDRLIGIIFLSMWFPKLFFSSYFQSELGFWLFIIWALLKDKNITKGIKDES